MALYFSEDGLPFKAPPYGDEERDEFEERLRQGGDSKIIRQCKSRNVIIIVPNWPDGTMAMKFGYVMCSALRCPREDMRLIEYAPARIFRAISAVSEQEFRDALVKPGISVPKRIRFVEPSSGDGYLTGKYGLL